MKAGFSTMNVLCSTDKCKKYLHIKEPTYYADQWEVTSGIPSQALSLRLTGRQRPSKVIPPFLLYLIVNFFLPVHFFFAASLGTFMALSLPHGSSHNSSSFLQNSKCDPVNRICALRECTHPMISLKQRAMETGCARVVKLINQMEESSVSVSTLTMLQ